MSKKLIAYAFAAIAGMCFVQGLAILTPGKGLLTTHGKIKGDCINA